MKKTLESRALSKLRTRVRGAVISPDDTYYDHARRVWNGRIDKYPALIVRCADITDVLNALEFARLQDLDVTVRSGGHSMVGLSVSDDGLVIDLSGMKSIWIDPVKRIAQVQAGLTLGEFVRQAQAFGLATTTGTVWGTGVGGLTLGGGIGWLMGKYGLTIDSLLSADLLTADGQVLTASANENPDLFWGLRGGGGNFGVVTSFEFQLHPVGPVLCGKIAYPLAKAGEVLRFYREYTSAAPDELTSYAAILTTSRGLPVVAISLCYCGPLREGERLVEPLRKLGQPVADGIQVKPYHQAISSDAGAPEGRHYYMPGNHDMELCFAEVREGILEGMGMAQDDGRICFCLTPGYRPLPDVYIEHGHAYHFLCCDRSGLWAAAGQVKTVNPQVMQLPLEARYVQHVAYPIVMHYPYLTRFAPSLGFARQTALLCLLNPAMLAEAVEHIWELLDGGAYGWPRTGSLPLARGLEGSPIALFDQTVKALMAFQRDAVARVPRWREPAGKKAALQAQVRGFMEVTMLRKTLSRVSKDMDVTRALARIFRLKRAATRDSVAAGMHTVLKSDPLLRYALAGHIHTERIDAIKSGTGEQQVYLNTGGWLRQLALPKPEEVTPKLVAWLREPDWEHMPLREVTPRHVFALVHAADGGPSRASLCLCLWEDGRNGHYRVRHLAV